MVDVTGKEMKLLFPETDVELGGQTFSVRPFSFVETRIVVKHLKEVLHLFGGEINLQTLAEMYEKAFDGLVTVIAMTFKIERDIVESFDMGTAMKAVTSIVEVNKSFFTGSVEDQVDGLATVLGMNEPEAKTNKKRPSPKQ